MALAVSRFAMNGVTVSKLFRIGPLGMGTMKLLNLEIAQ